jgi:hypothetical protein
MGYFSSMRHFIAAAVVVVLTSGCAGPPISGPTIPSRSGTPTKSTSSSGVPTSSATSSLRPDEIADIVEQKALPIVYRLVCQPLDEQGTTNCLDSESKRVLHVIVSNGDVIWFPI